MALIEELRTIAEYVCWDKFEDRFTSDPKKHPAWRAADALSAKDRELAEARKHVRQLQDFNSRRELDILEIASQRDEAMAALREKEEDERQFLEWAMNTLHEINVSNYDHDEVCRLNERSVEVILAIRSRMEPSTQNIGKNVSEDGQPVSGSREQRGNEEG